MFEEEVRRCMGAGLVGGEGFAIDASVMEADASRYHGLPGTAAIDWTDPRFDTRTAREYLDALDPEPNPQDAEGDLHIRSLFRLDGQGQQAGAVRLWAQLSDRQQTCGDC